MYRFIYPPAKHISLYFTFTFKRRTCLLAIFSLKAFKNKAPDARLNFSMLQYTKLCMKSSYPPVHAMLRLFSFSLPFAYFKVWLNSYVPPLVVVLLFRLHILFREGNSFQFNWLKMPFVDKLNSLQQWVTKYTLEKAI